MFLNSTPLCHPCAFISPQKYQDFTPPWEGHSWQPTFFRVERVVRCMNIVSTHTTPWFDPQTSLFSPSVKLSQPGDYNLGLQLYSLWMSSETFWSNKKKIQLLPLNFQITSPRWIHRTYLHGYHSSQVTSVHIIFPIHLNSPSVLIWLSGQAPLTFLTTLTL